MTLGTEPAMNEATCLLLPSFRLSDALAGEFASLAAGRALHVGYVAVRRCGIVSGDLRVSWRGASRPAGFVELASVESVAVYVDARLLDVLRRADPELRPGGILRRRTPGIRLGRPDLWIEFLDGPIVMSRRALT
ncbi:MAG: hypothetical protein ABI573_03295 [Chloroflexota bacterium]